MLRGEYSLGLHGPSVTLSLLGAKEDMRDVETVMTETRGETMAHWNQTYTFMYQCVRLLLIS